MKKLPKRKYFDLLSNCLNLFFMEMYRVQFGEFVCRYWGLKGQNFYEIKINKGMSYRYISTMYITASSTILFNNVEPVMFNQLPRKLCLSFYKVLIF